MDNESNPQAPSEGGASAPQPAAGDNLTDWREGLPADLKSEKTFEKFKDVPSLAKGYREAEKALSQRPAGVKVPGSGAKPEEVAAFHKALGVPDSADQYELTIPESPFPVAPEALAGFKTFAHQNHLTPAQAQSLIAYDVERTNVAASELRESLKTRADAELRKEWGPSFETNINLAKQAFDHLVEGDEEVRVLLRETGYGNHPALIKLFAKMGQYLAEEEMIGGEVGGASTREQALAKIKAVRADTKHAYYDSTHPDHKAAVEEMFKLQMIADPR